MPYFLQGAFKMFSLIIFFIEHSKREVLKIP